MFKVQTNDGKGAVLLCDTETHGDEFCWTPEGAIDVLWHDGKVVVECYVGPASGFLCATVLA